MDLLRLFALSLPPLVHRDERDMLLTRRQMIGAGIAAGAVALGGCTVETTQSAAATPRTTPDGRPLATTRAVPLSPVAERYGITPINYGPLQDGRFEIPAQPMSLIPEQFHRQVVPYSGPHAPGTIVVVNRDRHLFLVLPQGHALRYGVAVGAEGRAFRGTGTIYQKRAWPTWTPTANMIARDPSLRRFAGGYPGGLTNPLGARALYLMSGGRDRGYRIHGTPEWNSIGRFVSSGCIRMVQHDVIDLYNRVPLGTRVVVAG